MHVIWHPAIYKLEFETHFCAYPQVLSTGFSACPTSDKFR
jgi:hypothetical protein